MTDALKVILYPVTGEKLSRRVRDQILRTNEGVQIDEIDSYIKEEISQDVVSGLTKLLTDVEKKVVFKKAKLLCDAEYISYEQLNRLAFIGELLGIESTETGFNFNIFSEEQRQKNEYDRILINYSIITSAISFVPFSFIKDIFFTTPIQILMVNTMAKLYSFNLDGAKFLKIVGTATGLNVIFRVISSALSSFLPFNWIVRASMSFASTYAIGVLAKAYIDSNGEMGEDNLNEMFQNAYKEGKAVFEQFKGYILKNKNKIVSDFKENFF